MGTYFAQGRRIEDIQSAGYKVVTTVLADELSEMQALKLEAELISAFGTEDTGGLLTNIVIPSGIVKARPNIVVPSGIVEKAQIALSLLKNAVWELTQANGEGVTNAEVSKALGIQSDYAGGSKDYLSWSILGLLMREGKIVRGERKKHTAVFESH